MAADASLSYLTDEFTDIDPEQSFYWNADGDLVGSIEMPMAVGLVGGATKIHPAAKVAVKMLGVKTAGELAQIIAAVGLAQNMAAMRALATEGIQRGHMSLHARNLAATAGDRAKDIAGDAGEKAKAVARIARLKLSFMQGKAVSRGTSLSGASRMRQAAGLSRRMIPEAST
mgnify:CR=1 FL=1